MCFIRFWFQGEIRSIFYFLRFIFFSVIYFCLVAVSVLCYVISKTCRRARKLLTQHKNQVLNRQGLAVVLDVEVEEDVGDHRLGLRGPFKEHARVLEGGEGEATLVRINRMTKATIIEDIF